MKRYFTLALVVLLSFVVCSSAMAAGKYDVTQENFYVQDSYSIYGYVFARVENTGDKPVEYSAGLFEIYDENGDTLASDSWLTTYGKVLYPGEYCYIKGYEYIDTVDSADEVDDYMLTATGKSSSEDQMIRFEVDETSFDPEYALSAYYTEPSMFATFTNTTDETLYYITVVMALLDDDDNILDIEYVSLYSTIGVAPGATIVARGPVSSSQQEAYTKANYTPTHVDAYAYVDR